MFLTKHMQEETLQKQREITYEIERCRPYYAGLIRELQDKLGGFQPCSADEIQSLRSKLAEVEKVAGFYRGDVGFYGNNLAYFDAKLKEKERNMREREEQAKIKNAVETDTRIVAFKARVQELHPNVKLDQGLFFEGDANKCGLLLAAVLHFHDVDFEKNIKGVWITHTLNHFDSLRSYENFTQVFEVIKSLEAFADSLIEIRRSVNF